jgi:hypothetical protein
MTKPQNIAGQILFAAAQQLIKIRAKKLSSSIPVRE